MKIFQDIGISMKLIYRSSRYMIVIYFLLKIISSTIPIISIYIFNLFLTELINITNINPQIIFYLIGYIIIILFSLFISPIISIINNIISQKANNQYNLDITEHLIDLTLSFIDTSQGKNIIDDIRYTGGIICSFVFSFINIVTSIYQIIILLVSLLTFNPLFTGMFLLLSIPGIIFENRINKKTDIWRIRSAADVRKFSYYRWMLTASWPAKDVRMYDLTDPLKKRYNEEKRNYIKQKNSLLLKGINLSYVSIFIKYIGTAFFTVFLILRAADGLITIGEVTMYLGYVAMSVLSFESIMLYYLNYTTYIKEYFTKYTDFVSVKTDNESNGKNLPINSFESVIFDNVYFKYPTSDVYVLKGVSFTLNKGDRLSIVGINGAGKSTVIKLLIGLYQPESGQILLNGQPYDRYDIKDIRKLFSVLFQSFVEYPLTLRENIILSNLSSGDDETIKNILNNCGAWNDKFIDGLDTYMSRNFSDTGVELSKGQWQKIALARTYYKNAPVIVFDEPSAALDAEAEDKIFHDFSKLSDNRTGIMISHRISSARASNKIIVLNDGIIEEYGTHESLMSKDGLYAKLFNLQKEKYTFEEEIVSV